MCLSAARVLALLGALVLLLATCLGCGAGREAAAPSALPQSSGSAAPAAAPWFGAVVDRSRDFVVELAPRDLARDPAYGPLLRRALTLASASGGPLHGSSLDVVAGADDVVVAVRGGPNDVVCVIAGVPASLDPQRVLGESGEPAFVLRREARSDRDVAELVARSETELPFPTTLFVVPGRTWILGVGEGAVRVRSALERTAPATPYVGDSGALVTVSLGAEVLDRVRARIGPALAPIARGLVRLALSLDSGEKGLVHAELSYDASPRAKDATRRVREAGELLLERWLPGVHAADWLEVGGPEGARDRSVLVTLRVPTTVLEALARPDEPKPP